MLIVNRRKDEAEMEKSETENMVVRNLEESMTEYWGHRSASYSSQNIAQLFGEKRESWEETIFSHMNGKRNLKVLDIGTGPGFFAILCALRGHEVTAVDMSKDMLEKARVNAHLAGAEEGMKSEEAAGISMRKRRIWKRWLQSFH